MLVSTLLILAVCMAVSLPLGLGAALWLSEVGRNGHALGRVLRRLLDVLAGTPSIVIGLFGNALFSQALGLGFSILAGGLTLACMVLPLLIRTTEEAFSAVPPSCAAPRARWRSPRPAPSRSCCCRWRCRG